MKKILLAAISLATSLSGWCDTEKSDSTALTEPTLSQFMADSTVEKLAPQEMVVVGGDTISMVLPDRNFGRYHRGLFNYLFIPKGQWEFGLTASYGELNTDDVQILSMIKNIDFKGKIYSVNPTISYSIGNNRSVGLRFNYSRGNAGLASLSMDFDEDLNFNLKDVSYSTQSYGVALFFRNYIGLSTDKRFAIFNEVEASVNSGSSRFIRQYNEQPRDTRTYSTSAGLNFSPGVCMFIMDYVSFNVSFGVFGLHLKHEKQTTDGVDDGTRTTSGANFRFNLFNIKFGIGVHI